MRKAYLALVYVFLYTPIAVLMILSFNKAGLPTAWTGFSTDWYGRLLESPKIVAAARNSLVVAVASTLIATAIGTLLALGVERRRASAG
ncbi:MAG: ABC transporter permease, partial [Parvibaculaceae bacterium]